MNSANAILLLRSLGSALSDEPPSTRINLAKQLWQILEAMSMLFLSFIF